jgi:hypothetical protein
MTREFIHLKEFEKNWIGLGFTEDDLRDLELFLCQYPDSGSIIPGTGGLRKLRWATHGKGKRGGARVCYLDLIVHEKIYFITAYSKSEKEDLDSDSKKVIRNLINILEKESGK